jgi:hypothetical protein
LLDQLLKLRRGPIFSPGEPSDSQAIERKNAGLSSRKQKRNQQAE